MANYLRLALLGLLLLISQPLVACAAERPNILWISCEDISPHLGCYGDPHAITPHLDQLASEGVRYSHAYTTAGVCAPCRSTIITGMYQNSIGTHHMRSEAKLPGWLKPFPMALRQAGYYCTNNNKTDYQFAIPSPAEIWDESSGRAHWKNASSNQPFFAVFNFTGCHETMASRWYNAWWRSPHAPRKALVRSTNCCTICRIRMRLFAVGERLALGIVLPSSRPIG